MTSEYSNSIAPSAKLPEDYLTGKSDQYGWPINNFTLSKTYGTVTLFKVRDVAVAANVMALCRAFTDKYYAVEKGAARHDILAPMNPMVPEVRFIEQWVDKAAYEEHKKSPLVKEFIETLAKYGASAEETTVEEYDFEDGQKYGQSNHNAGRRISSQFTFGIVVNLAVKTPEIAQAQVKILRGHLERQLSTEPHALSYTFIGPTAAEPTKFRVLELWTSAQDYWELHLKSPIYPLLKDMLREAGMKIEEGECTFDIFSMAEHAEGQTMAEPGKYVATGKSMWDFTLDNKMWRE